MISVHFQVSIYGTADSGTRLMSVLKDTLPSDVSKTSPAVMMLGYPQSKADTSSSLAPIKVSLMDVLLLSLPMEKMGAGDLILLRS